MSNGRQPTSKDVARLLKLRETQPAEPPEPEAALRMAAAETRSGRGEGGTDPAGSEFVRSLAKRVIREGSRPFSQAHPAWVRALVEKNADDDEVIEAAKKRLSRAPTRANLLLAQAMANDLGRKPGGGERLRKVLTQDLVDQLIGKEG